MKVDLMAIFLGILFIIAGGLIGWLIMKFTKLKDNLTESQRHQNKILNDPELLIKKIKETVTKMEPNGKGDIRYIDGNEEIILGIKEVKGKKVLDVKRIPYTPTDKDMSPMMLASKVAEATQRKIKEIEAAKDKKTQEDRELEQMNSRQELKAAKEAEAAEAANNEDIDPQAQ